LGAENFENLLKTLLRFINSLTEAQRKKEYISFLVALEYSSWNQVLELLKLLNSSMNQTTLSEINSAIDSFKAATTPKAREIAVENLASAVVRQLHTYSMSSHAGFSVQTVRSKQ
jgi:hypothetical protein